MSRSPARKTAVSTLLLTLGAAFTLCNAQGPSTQPGTRPFGRGQGGGGFQAPPVGILPANAPGKDPFWGTWPNTDPNVVGKRLALNYLSRTAPVSWGETRNIRAQAWYGEACVEFGALRVAEQINDKELADKLVERFASIITPEGEGIIPPVGHVDRAVFGIVPFEIYMVGQQDKFLAAGKAIADSQWSPTPPRSARTPDGDAAAELGLSYQTRFWIDDMYMITSLQVQAYRATRQMVYLDRASKEMVAYLDKLQQPSGLFYHGEGSNFYWGRGNGWVAVGMTELLSELPVDHPNYAAVLAGYKKMMAALLKNQAEDGMWRQLIDKPGSWKESSCTGMFTFAFAMGVRQGWLPEKEYKAPAKKAWTALCGYLDDNANIKDVCVGTNKGFTEQYYNNRQRVLGDLHGQAGMIWAAWAMARQPEPSAK